MESNQTSLINSKHDLRHSKKKQTLDKIIKHKFHRALNINQEHTFNY